MRIFFITAAALLGLALAGCGDDKPAHEPLPWQVPGPAGKDGVDGVDGEPGKPGAPGKDGALGPGSAVAGARLAPRMLEGEDGSKMFTGTWTDTARDDEACAFQNIGTEFAPSAEVRCLPAFAKAPGIGLGAFSSPTCTGEYAGGPTYGGRMYVHTLGDGKFLRVGDPVVQGYLINQQTGICEPYPFDEDWHAWPEVPPSAFVKATEN